MENSFADPFLVGALPSGIFGISIASLAGMSALHSPMFAMLFIVIVLPIIYNLSKVDKKLNKQLLLLIGVGVSFILISLTVIFEIIGGKSLFQTLLWLMGTIKMEESLWRITPIWILPGIIACFYLAKHLDPLPKLTGPYYQARKIRSEMGKKCLLLFVAVLIGGIVPSAGIIAFFGFMISYPLRLLLQRSNRLLVLTSALAGASILPLLDLFSNLIFKETNLPVGVFTALIGTGVFIYFLKKTGPMELKFQSS
jgi:iron complex transport system permease protein